MAFLLNEPDVAADTDGVCAYVRLLEMKTYQPVHMKTPPSIPADLPLEAFVRSFGRCRGRSRVHHVLVPAKWRGCRAELRPQRCPTGWHPRSYTTHSSTQGPGAGEHGQCQEVRFSLATHFPRMHQLRLMAALYSAWCVFFFFPSTLPHTFGVSPGGLQRTHHSCTNLIVIVFKHSF